LVLVLVLWILTILMVIALSLSYMVRTDLAGTFAHLRDTEDKYLALSGIERAKAELVYRRFKLHEEGAEVWRVDGTPYEYDLGSGIVKVRILNESSKIDINAASEALLRQLFITQGLSEQEADVIVDSIMDWKDTDNIPRPNGAEEDYYARLPKPYGIKNGLFDSVDELLYVRGMTREILYGGRGKRGIADLLTVYSGHNMVSVKYADRDVLRAVPGLTEEIIDAIIERRKEREIRGPQDLQDVLGQSMGEVNKYLSFSESPFFRVESEGRSHRENKRGYGIRAVLALEGNNKFSIRYYKEPVWLKW
jgi:general secretion pathway protein K